MSNNLEANYALPTNSTDFTQGLYNNILFVDGVKLAGTDRASLGFNLFSRRNIYDIIEQRISNIYGIDGHACLLRMICEVSKSSFAENNGVMGSLFHILFTWAIFDTVWVKKIKPIWIFSPSSSILENNTDDYFSAENAQKCQKFNSRCSLSFMRLISALMK